MKKIDKREIMTQAWRTFKANYKKINFSECLKNAWKIAKTENKGGVELKGSEKQVSWAKDIRTKMIENIITLMNNEKKEKFIIRRQKAIEVINNIEDAKFFIENRNEYAAAVSVNIIDDVKYYVLDLDNQYRIAK